MHMNRKDKFIDKAVAGGRGKFSAKAEKAGMTTREFADDKEDAGGKLGKEAVLAKTLMAMHKKK